MYLDSECYTSTLRSMYTYTRWIGTRDACVEFKNILYGY
jgi:hypothetical protein